MKKQDFIFVLVLILFFLPFFVWDPVRQFYMEANRNYPILVGFVKFAVLATLGEVIALRIRKGVYNEASFGILPKMIVWGFLGAWIVIAMKIFGMAAPKLLDQIFVTDRFSAAMQSGLSWTKLASAFSISLLMNTSFAPVFMLLHKVSDTHIQAYGGKLSALCHPIQFSKILSELNWNVQWNFVFKKTIPFFWIPAHTLTFMLPVDFQVLFAALLGVVLGIIMAVAANKK